MILAWTLETGLVSSGTSLAVTVKEIGRMSSGLRVGPTLIVSVLIAETEVVAWSRTGGSKDVSIVDCETCSHPIQHSERTALAASDKSERSSQTRCRSDKFSEKDLTRAG